MFFSWKGAVKYLSKFDIRISHVFVRLILPVFFFEAISCTKNVEHELKKLNMNDNNGKYGHENNDCRKIPFYLQNSFSKKNWDSNFSRTEEIYVVPYRGKQNGEKKPGEKTRGKVTNFRR